jgi:hypothetical protein
MEKHTERLAQLLTLFWEIAKIPTHKSGVYVADTELSSQGRLAIMPLNSEVTFTKEKSLSRGEWLHVKLISTTQPPID